jgi:Ice-binding-like
MKLRRYFPLTAIFLVLLLLAAPVRAAVLPPLGTAANFGVLAASTVTNTGATVVMGDLGVSPGTAVTGFPPGTVTGTIHPGDAVALQAQTDAAIAYNNAAGQACDVNLTGQNLGGLTLTAAVYCFASSAQLTGQLTLDGQGNSNSVFIFQIGSTLSTASSSRATPRWQSPAAQQRLATHQWQPPATRRGRLWACRRAAESQAGATRPSRSPCCSWDSASPSGG